jgi:hypothetical protein
MNDFELAALLADARQGGDPQAFVAALPYARMLGLEIRRDAESAVRVVVV